MPCTFSVATWRPSCVRARSLRSDRAWLELSRYIATDPCACSVAMSFLRFLGEPILPFRNVFGKRVLKEKSRAHFIALPVAKSRSKVFNYLKNCGVCLGVSHKRSGGWDIVLIKRRRILVFQRSQISANTTRQAIITRDHNRAKRNLIPNLRISVYNKVLAWVRELSARFLVLKTLRRLNLIESHLEISKTESCLIALSAKFAVKKSSLCLSPSTPYIFATRSVYAFSLMSISRCSIKMEIFHFRDLRNYLPKLRIYPRKFDIYLSLRTKRKPSYG
ncbi:hypothetical protein IGI04_026175 [Brassica rapa subsp. trilocularis]|uniref:Uncharacterized protein n=1 Tax=Brassica rapa subsp. trilocularis TaxID=1813537 RepID=A0ABQ7KVI9_BRACM|nr:hypothetical protein IGI04_026175 [Brassica rapa subsp. trilocularis]